jgi:hypothetical protein
VELRGPPATLAPAAASLARRIAAIPGVRDVVVRGATPPSIEHRLDDEGMTRKGVMPHVAAEALHTWRGSAVLSVRAGSHDLPLFLSFEHDGRRADPATVLLPSLAGSPVPLSELLVEVEGAPATGRTTTHVAFRVDERPMAEILLRTALSTAFLPAGVKVEPRARCTFLL